MRSRASLPAQAFGLALVVSVSLALRPKEAFA